MKNVDHDDVRETLRRNHICVVLPTYNNGATLGRIIDGVASFCDDIIVVNDGSTDETAAILDRSGDKVDVIDYKPNRGKGYALKQGFKRALARGFDYAITLDTDGQHLPSDIPAIAAAIIANPGALIVGQRDLSGVDINGKSSFANRFSNFWFRLQTMRRLHDTQTGYRAYPLSRLPSLWLMSNRYEAELTLLVLSAWRGIRLVEVNINVYYPPQSERVSHFRPGIDFARISLLNTALCAGAVLYGAPMGLARAMRRLPMFDFEFRPFTRRKGQPREAAITFGRLGRSLFAISFFLIGSVVLLTPATIVYFAVGRNSDSKKLRYHKMLCRVSGFIARHLPGAKAGWERVELLERARPSVIVCNHQSHLDLMMLMSLDPRIVFLTNDWVWRNPFYGVLIHRAEFLPVTMGFDRLIPKLRDLVDRGYSIMVFPEGTRSADGRVGRFHQGAFAIAREINLDVTPMVLHGASEFLPKKDFMFRRGRLTLRVLPPVNFPETETLRSVASSTRRLIADELQQMAAAIEKTDYYIPLVRYRYAWRGRAIVNEFKRRVRHLTPELHNLIDRLPESVKRVRLLNAGIGVEALLLALVNPEVEVDAYEPRRDLFEIAVSTPAIPANLKFHNPVWESQYGADNEFDLTITVEK